MFDIQKFKEAANGRLQIGSIVSRVQGFQHICLNGGC